MTFEGATTDPNDSAWELAGLDPALAQDWHVWSVVLGRTIRPALAALEQRVPKLVSAIACTADGFNLCAVNADDHSVTRMAALTSSQYALGSATAELIGADHDESAGMFAMEHGHRRTVIVGRRQQLIGHALIQVVADDTSLGHLMVAAHACADEVCKLLDLEVEAQLTR